MSIPFRTERGASGGGQADVGRVTKQAPTVEAGALTPIKVALLQVGGFVDTTIDLTPAQRQEKLLAIMPDIDRLIGRIITELMHDLDPANVDVEYLKKIINAFRRYEAIQTALTSFIQQVVRIEIEKYEQATTEADLNQIFDRLLRLTRIIERYFPVNVSGLVTPLGGQVNKMQALAQKCVSKYLRTLVDKDFRQ